MTSKQEKLAAARKRLKEFQGKNKEVEISKRKVISDVPTPKILNNDFYLNNSMTGSGPLLTGNENSSICDSGMSPHQEMRKTPAALLNEGNFHSVHPECNNINLNLEKDCRGKMNEEEKLENNWNECANGQKMDFIEPFGKNGLEIGNCSNMSANINPALMEGNQGDNCTSFYQNDNIGMPYSDAKQFVNCDVTNKSPLNETIMSLQKELQSHAQAMAILVQQRNDAQIALSKSQSLLNQKSGEAEALAQQIANLTSSVSNLTQRLVEAEALIKKLNLEKEEVVHRWNESKSLNDNFQAELDKREEEFEEMRRKYGEKNKDCQQLLVSLGEAQAQLSFYQIQLKQYSNEGHSGLAVQVSELQNECVILKQKVEELEGKLEIEKSEKEESSQKFHIYAQQCNSQLSSLNSQLKSLKLEKENLSKENVILSRNLSELESAREKTASKPSEGEVAELHEQVKALSAENEKLSSDLKEKEEERARLEYKMEEKELELDRLFEAVKGLSEENKRLAREVEMPKADERLLATMESDKVAAAKAVAQNQSLKKQVVELEQAFIKLSEEKLELTNKLAHEKHISVELQSLLRNAREEKHENDHEHECRHGDKRGAPLLDDSGEIEELRSIVRQLQDDKMELTARLKAYESGRRSEERGQQGREEDCAEEGTQCEDTKLLLQQMKEKVRRTMNEIAVLDEEKEKLEHLVMQLQGETETIGEYITLYQKQRMLLRQRAQEKDSQLLQLSRDKEELKSKLAALDELVQRLISERESIGISSGSKLADQNLSVQIPEHTAGKIRALINEIGSTTLIDNQSIAFQHCSCCSGRLITI